jgi:hypothetical protein
LHGGARRKVIDHTGFHERHMPFVACGVWAPRAEVRSSTSDIVRHESAARANLQQPAVFCISAFCGWSWEARGGRV